jgi:hypothetical protein
LVEFGARLSEILLRKGNPAKKPVLSAFVINTDLGSLYLAGQIVDMYICLVKSPNKDEELSIIKGCPKLRPWV